MEIEEPRSVLDDEIEEILHQCSMAEPQGWYWYCYFRNKIYKVTNSGKVELITKQSIFDSIGKIHLMDYVSDFNEFIWIPEIGVMPIDSMEVQLEDFSSVDDSKYDFEPFYECAYNLKSYVPKPKKSKWSTTNEES